MSKRAQEAASGATSKLVDEMACVSPPAETGFGLWDNRACKRKPSRSDVAIPPTPSKGSFAWRPPPKQGRGLIPWTRRPPTQPRAKRIGRPTTYTSFPGHGTVRAKIARSCPRLSTGEPSTSGALPTFRRRWRSGGPGKGQNVCFSPRFAAHPVSRAAEKGAGPRSDSHAAPNADAAATPSTTTLNSHVSDRGRNACAGAGLQPRTKTPRERTLRKPGSSQSERRSTWREKCGTGAEATKTGTSFAPMPERALRIGAPCHSSA